MRVTEGRAVGELASGIAWPRGRGPHDRRQKKFAGGRNNAVAQASHASMRCTPSMIEPSPRARRAAALAVLFAFVCASAAAQDAGAAFKAENDAAMDRMMAGMAVRSSGDIDRDFAEMMISHHQGAIDMAQAELRHGRNEQLRRIAQEIIVSQQQEIAAMRLALGDSLPQSAPAPTQAVRPPHPEHRRP